METKSETALRIVEAARRLFMIHGYHKVSVDIIAKEANVAKGTLYHHFASKEDLALEIVDVFLQDELNVMKTIPNSQDDPWEVLEKYIREVLDTSARQDKGILLILDLMTALAEGENLPKLLEIANSFFSNLNQVFTGAGLGDDNTITILMALIDGLGLQALLRPTYFTEERISEIAKLAITLIRGEGKQ